MSEQIKIGHMVEWRGGSLLDPIDKRPIRRGEVVNIQVLYRAVGPSATIEYRGPRGGRKFAYVPLSNCKVVAA